MQTICSRLSAIAVSMVKIGFGGVIGVYSYHLFRVIGERGRQIRATPPRPKRHDQRVCGWNSKTSPRVARTFLAVNNTRSPTNRVPLSRYDVEAKLYSRSVSSQPSFDFYPPGPNF